MDKNKKWGIASPLAKRKKFKTLIILIHTFKLFNVISIKNSQALIVKIIKFFYTPILIFIIIILYGGMI